MRQRREQKPSRSREETRWERSWKECRAERWDRNRGRSRGTKPEAETRTETETRAVQRRKPAEFHVMSASRNWLESAILYRERAVNERVVIITTCTTEVKGSASNAAHSSGLRARLHKARVRENRLCVQRIKERRVTKGTYNSYF